MQVHYINLDYRPERNEYFLNHNSSIVQCIRFSAVDGKRLDINRLAQLGVVDDPIPPYSMGALGAALSHKSLWEKCASENQIIHIAEDDTVLNAFFPQKAFQMIQSLPPNWDFIAWCWNRDSFLHVSLPNGVMQTAMHFDPRALNENMPHFQNSEFPISPLRLYGMFGLPCYTLSPQGARQLLSLCFPLKTESIHIPCVNKTVPNQFLSTLLNKFYRQINAFVAFPPLAWTDHDIAKSDTGVLARTEPAIKV